MLTSSSTIVFSIFNLATGTSSDGTSWSPTVAVFLIASTVAVLTLTLNDKTVLPGFTSTLFHVIVLVSLSYTPLPTIEPSTKAVPSGTLSDTFVVPDNSELFVKVIVYVYISLFLANATLGVFSTSIYGILASGVSCPLTLALLVITLNSPSSLTIALNCNFALPPAGTTTLSHLIVPSI